MSQLGSQKSYEVGLPESAELLLDAEGVVFLTRRGECIGTDKGGLKEGS
jgi:hypothetical protein